MKSTQDNLIKQRNALARLKNELMDDFRSYSEPPICQHLSNACSEIDEAIMCCTKE